MSDEREKCEMDIEINPGTDSLGEGGSNYETLRLPIAAGVGVVAKGQVLVYNTSTHNWKKYVSGHTGLYAIALEAATITESARILCMVMGHVNIDGLNTTAKADPDIVAALLRSGIIAQTAVEL